jgi:DNA modification methylase
MSENLEIVYIGIDHLKKFADNPRKEKDRNALEKLKALIKEHGFQNPLQVYEENNGYTILCGNHRFDAGLQLGRQSFPCIIYRGDRRMAIARAISDNKSNEWTCWDDERLEEQLLDLQKNEFNLALTGFDDMELEALLDREVIEDDFDADKEYENIEKPESVYGDIFKLGRHRLMCGDSRIKEDVERLMAGALARLVFTDPPYNVNYKSPGGLTYDSDKFGSTGGKMLNDNLAETESLGLYIDVLKNLYHFSTEDVSLYWWFANRNAGLNQRAFFDAGWHMSQVIIWLKNSPVFSYGQDYHRCYEPCMFGWKDRKTHYTNLKIRNLRDVFHLSIPDLEEIFDVWYQKRDVTQNYLHPTQKPVKLAERAIRKNSLEGDIVLDVFGGSGSTLIAAEQMNRTCYLMELDPKYCDVEIKRWENFVGGSQRFPVSDVGN